MGDKGFFCKDGLWYCDKLSLLELREDLGRKYSRPTPVMVYSQQKLIDNLKAYQCCASSSIEIGYSMKANNNLQLLKIIAAHVDRIITVSGYEIQMALRAGFKNESVIYNGNGKERWEIELAIKENCLLNVDSQFDANHIVEAVTKLEKEAKVFVRVNPNLNPEVHPYISTGLADSKFGVEIAQLPEVLSILKHPGVKVVGLHCHLGSTIKSIDIFKDAAIILNKLGTKLRQDGFPNLEYLNLGGGLGIDYTGEDVLPQPSDMISAIRQEVSPEFKIIVEPGRSIVGNAGALLVDVIGTKKNVAKSFVIINGAMNDVLRPSMYSGYHRITPLQVHQSAEMGKYDVVGPICESADFLGKDRMLPALEEGESLAILDCGAYCSAMASNYNLRGRAMEVMVEDYSWRVVRTREGLEDIISCME
ncbi:uncharacterized protein LOC136036443 [Artemia franciscana]|uniref:uncharacterized protein LOC136036443 n=1 Tax=Artemia franciscana TaxID=6661 RepID=UPI0032DB6C0F